MLCVAAFLHTRPAHYVLLCGQWLVVGRRSPAATAAATAAVGSDGGVQLGRERVDRRISIGALLFRTVVGQSVRHKRLPPPSAVGQEFLIVGHVSDQYGQVRALPPPPKNVFFHPANPPLPPLPITTPPSHVSIHTIACRLLAHSGAPLFPCLLFLTNADVS